MGCALSLRHRSDEWAKQVQAYQFSARGWQADADALLADYDLLRQHPAFPSAERKFQETRARILVEGSDQENSRFREMVRGLSLDELLVLRAHLVLSERWDGLKQRFDALEAERLQLLAEHDELERAAQRRRTALDSLATFAILQQTLKASSPVNCTTQYLGGMAFTNCR
jgi:hypothetical protein